MKHPWIDGRRAIFATEFRERGPSLNWFLCGTLVRKGERPVSWERVERAYKEAFSPRQLYETVDRIVYRIRGEPNWFEGRR